MSQRLHLILKAGLCLLLSAATAAAGSRPKAIPPPDDYQLERMVGNRLETAVRVSAWQAPEPQQTNWAIYSVALPQMDEALMRRVAAHFGVKGQIEQIRGDTLGHIGYWIKESNPGRPQEDREVKFWLTIGSFSYGTGDNGYRYDPKTKTHPVFGVPTKEEARAKALQMLPLVGLTTNDLQLHPDGRIASASSSPGITYTDRSDGQRKRVVIQQNVSFYQRVPFGGRTVGVGDGGKLTFSFVSEAKVSGIEWFFRKLVKAGEAKPKASKEIMKDIAKRNAWTWHQRVPSRVTVTECVLVYPQGNSWLHQEYVWPFYMLTATGSDGQTLTLYVPLEW
jgi:hypothetical protein